MLAKGFQYADETVRTDQAGAVDGDVVHDARVAALAGIEVEAFIRLAIFKSARASFRKNSPSAVGVTPLCDRSKMVIP